MGEAKNFLKGLDEKLHKIAKCHGTGKWAHKTFYVDEYTDENMSPEEIEKVLDISNKPSYVIYPINTAMGFSVGYDVSKIIAPGKRKVLLRFKQGQLPEGYNFEKMSETFMKKSNRAKARLIGEKIINDYDHYDY